MSKVQETYTIIKDEKLLLEFIEWLPELIINEVFYLALFARKKYCKELQYIKTDKAQCARLESKKDWLVNRIKKLEVPIGTYYVKDTQVPQEALALYISINPRCLYNATKTGLIKFAQLMTQEYNGYNPRVEIMSEIHRSKGRKLFSDFDIDNPDSDVYEKINSYLNPESYKILKTRGGIHVVVEHSKIESKFKNTWYKNLASIKGSDVTGDILLPVPGCVQGDFVPHFIK